MYRMNLDWGTEKESRSETRAWLNRWGLPWHPWGRTFQVSFVERWVSGSGQVKAKPFCDCVSRMI